MVQELASPSGGRSAARRPAGRGARQRRPPASPIPTTGSSGTVSSPGTRRWACGTRHASRRSSTSSCVEIAAPHPARRRRRHLPRRGRRRAAMAASRVALTVWQARDRRGSLPRLSRRGLRPARQRVLARCPARSAARSRARLARSEHVTIWGAWVCTLLYTMRHGVSSRSRRRVRVHRGRAAAAPRTGTPRSRSSTLTADSNAGAPVADAVPVARRRRTRTSRYEPLDPADLAGLDVVFLGAPARRSRRRSSPSSSTRSATSSTSAPTSGCRAPPTSTGTARPHTAPELLDRFAFGLPELYRDEIAPPATSRRPAAIRRRVVARARAARSPTGSSSRRASWSTRSRGSRAPGAALEVASLFGEIDENVEAYGLLTHRHTAEMEMALAQGRGRDGAGAVHAAPRAHDAGHPRDVLRAADGRRARPPTELLGDVPRRSTPTSRSWSVTDEPPATKATLGIERRARHRPLRRAHRHGPRARRDRQPREGRVGSGDPVRQPAARAPGDHRRCPWSG